MNVGGHRITNDQLRAQFEALGFTDVATVLASGNVVFGATTGDLSDEGLERRIEAHLADALGYAVPTFVRSATEIEKVASHVPVPGSAPGAGESIQVMFLRAAPTAADRERIAALSTDHDTLRVDGRELYWFCRGRSLEATYDQKALTAIIGKVVTVRTQATAGKLLAKF
jgi:uncharacterized protein (DUF1697 family)